ncbi:MAG TPA: hypothetical protein VEV40_00475 [Alloacidobacterium sp.]|nr:hypothetical protein [Alloacidobacterium sp.]HYK34400.1 hypothetical protein [Alloacidobacterium sp.]
MILEIWDEPSLRRGLFVLVVQQTVVGRQHTLVKDSADEYAAPHGPVKDDVSSPLDATEAWMDQEAGSAQFRHLGNLFEAINKIGKIRRSPHLAPFVGGIVKNFGQIRFSLF